MRWAEFVPAAPLLPELAVLTGYVVAFGLCILAVYFCKALFGAAEKGLGWIPWVGSKITGDLKRIEQRLQNYLGGAAANFEVGIAKSWHRTAQISEWMAGEIKRNAAAMLSLAEVIANPFNIPAWKSLWGDLHGRVASLPHIAAGKVAVGLRPIVGELRGVERWTFPRVKALEHEVAVDIPHDLAGLRARTRTLENEYTRLFKWIRTHEGALGIATLTGAVAIALARLGGSWIRCNNWKRVGRSVCGLPANLIEDFLALLTDFVVLTNICTVIPWLEAAFSEVAAPVISVLAKAGAGLCSHESSRAAPLDVPRLYLPASTGATLHLP
jgi:hypothetical protein